MAEEEEFVPFDPANFGLEKTFRLTKFSDLRGWGCKVPQEVLTGFLAAIEPTLKSNPTDKTRIGMYQYF